MFASGWGALARAGQMTPRYPGRGCSRGLMAPPAQWEGADLRALSHPSFPRKRRLRTIQASGLPDPPPQKERPCSGVLAVQEWSLTSGLKQRPLTWLACAVRAPGGGPSSWRPGAPGAWPFSFSGHRSGCRLSGVRWAGPQGPQALPPLRRRRPVCLREAGSLGDQLH